MSALTETTNTAPAKVLTKIRKSLVSMFGNEDADKLNSRYEKAVDILKDFKSVAKINDAQILKINTILAGKIMTLHLENLYLNGKIYYYQAISSPVKPQIGGFNRGFNGGNFSGGGSGNRKSW